MTRLLFPPEANEPTTDDINECPVDLCRACGRPANLIDGYCSRCDDHGNEDAAWNEEDARDDE